MECPLLWGLTNNEAHLLSASMGIWVVLLGIIAAECADLRSDQPRSEQDYNQVTASSISSTQEVATLRTLLSPSALFSAFKACLSVGFS